MCSYFIVLNAVGSYTCSCQSGYELSSDNHTSIDIDECAISALININRSVANVLTSSIIIK